MYREIHRWNVLYLFVTSLGQTFTAELSCTLVVTWCYVTMHAEILSWIVMCVHMADPEAKVHRWIQLLDINSPRPTKFITEIGCHHAWADSLLNWLRLSICITFWRECRKCSGPTKMNFENSIVINRTCLYGFLARFRKAINELLFPQSNKGSFSNSSDLSYTEGQNGICWCHFKWSCSEPFS